MKTEINSIDVTKKKQASFPCLESRESELDFALHTTVNNAILRLRASISGNGMRGTNTAA